MQNNPPPNELSEDDKILLDLLANSDLTPTEAANRLVKSPMKIQQQLVAIRVYFNVKTNMTMVSKAIEAGVIGTNSQRSNAATMLTALLTADGPPDDSGMQNIKPHQQYPFR